MQEPWELTLEMFLGEYSTEMDPPDLAERYARQEVEDAALWGWLLPGWIDISEEYAIAVSRNVSEDIILLHADPDEGRWVACGGYVGSSLWIAPAHRREGLGPKLVLAKSARCPGGLAPQSYSLAGLRTHVAAHRLSVERALKRGMRPRAEVMSAHPSLACRVPA